MLLIGSFVNSSAHSFTYLSDFMETIRLSFVAIDSKEKYITPEMTAAYKVTADQNTHRGQQICLQLPPALTTQEQKHSQQQHNTERAASNILAN
jgi:hypothetical protein